MPLAQVKGSSGRKNSASLPGGDRIFRLGDGAPHHDIVRAQLSGPGGGGDALLVVLPRVGKADAGGDGDKSLAADFMDLARLQGRAHYPVQPGRRGVAGIGEDHVLQGLVDEQLFGQGRLVGAGELSDGDEQRSCPVGTGEPLQGRRHHGPGAGGVEIHKIHVQAGEHPHGLFHGVGNVVQLQIQEDPVPPGLDLAYDLGTDRIEEFHADLHKGLFSAEAVQKCKGLRGVGKIAGDDDVFSHVLLL